MDGRLGPAMTTTMRSGNGSPVYDYTGDVVVDQELNEVVLETTEGERLTCGALVPLDFKGKRVRVMVAVQSEVDIIEPSDGGMWDIFRRTIS